MKPERLGHRATRLGQGKARPARAQSLWRQTGQGSLGSRCGTSGAQRRTNSE